MTEGSVYHHSMVAVVSWQYSSISGAAQSVDPRDPKVTAAWLPPSGYRHPWENIGQDKRKKIPLCTPNIGSHNRDKKKRKILLGSEKMLTPSSFQISPTHSYKNLVMVQTRNCLRDQLN